MASSVGRRAVLRAAAVGACLPAARWIAAAESREELKTELLRTGLFMVRGGGANTLVRLTPLGLILVDAKRDESFGPLMAQVRRVNRLADLPLRVLVLTGGDEDRSGGAARFLAAGATVLAAPAIASRFEPAPAAEGRKAPGAVLPFDARRDIELGGARLVLLPVGPARATGEAVVHFPDLQVTAVGGLYVQGEPRSLLGEGGSLAGWAAALDRVLGLDLGLVVPADGPPVGRAELLTLRARLPAGA
jgi:glyoxylase-like metal-dependent hydrolase (beta-lactamase superfamily II)